MKSILLEQEESLICEALVKEIREAKRWSAVVDAWQALLSVRRKAKQLQAEWKRLNKGEETAAKGEQSC